MHTKIRILIVITAVFMSFQVNFGQNICPEGDLNDDCLVNLQDLQIMSEQWLAQPGCQGYPLGCGDLVGNDGVNLGDFAQLASNWLESGGALLVVIEPQEAVSAGARWQVDEGEWQDSNVLLRGINPGLHTVEFSDVEGWITPLQTTVQISYNQTTTVHINYEKYIPPLMISEFMAINTHTLADPQNPDDYPDWIEIYNPSGDTVDLQGWSLTDDPCNLRKWIFPHFELAAGQFLVVFASGENRTDPAQPLHTNFNLEKNGEFLALVADDGKTIVSQFAPAYPHQLVDISYGYSQYATTLIKAGTTARYHVPTASDAGENWTDVDYDDSAWETARTPVGFKSNWRAYNDCIYADGQYIADNVTTYGIGNSFPGETSGELKDIVTGEGTGVTVSFTQGGGVNWQPNPTYGGHDCAEGTDAYSTFGGITDMTGVIYYGSTGWWVEMTISGLNPGSEYTIATSAARGNYPNRLTNYTLLDADTFTNSSTEGVTVLAENKVQFNTGDNINEGYVARWTGITAADGSFTVRAEADPSSDSGRKAYSFDVFELIGQADSTLQEQMLNKTASLWTRIEFDVDDPAFYDILTLNIKYDDGFVAFINGQKVAQRNAPANLQWNSTATEDRPDDKSLTFESINLMSFLHTLRRGRNVLAIQALNDSTDNEKFTILPELVAATNTATAQYFSKSTPGKFNVPGSVGVVADVQFSYKRGFYQNPINLTLTTDTPGALIRYTLDGSTPSAEEGIIYDGQPISIDKTSIVRAVAVKAGYLSSRVDTNTYIYINDVINQSGVPGPGWPSGSVNGQVFDYGMDRNITKNDSRYKNLIDDALLAIPSISIVTDLDNLFNPSKGIYVNARNDGRNWERPASVELINPDGSRGFQINAGLRIRGGYSRSGNNPKHAFRLFFRGEYGDPKLQYPLFDDEGVDEFDKVDLRCSQNYSWSFMGDSRNTAVREVFQRDTQRDMGQPYTRSRYYHLYLDGQYWGLYMTQERSEARFAASYFGGNPEDYDTIKHSGGRRIATDGDTRAWDTLFNEAMQGFADNERYYRVQGLNPDGTRNPAYPKMVDIDNLIVYMIGIFYSGDKDAPISNFMGNRGLNNFYVTYNRKNPNGFISFRHDGEHTLDVGMYDRVGPWNDPVFTNANYFNPQTLHQKLIEHPDYRMRFADIVYKTFFHHGPLSPPAASERLLARAHQIELAIIGESARWGDAKHFPAFTRDDNWWPAINNIVNNYFPNRRNQVVTLLKNVGWYPTFNPPAFSVRGGRVDAGFLLTLQPAAGTAIYYTLDGTDPRMRGGAINPDALTNPDITLEHSTIVKARSRKNDQWSPLDEVTFAVGPIKDSLRITEIMYHPAQPPSGDPNAEFVELKNISQDTINVNLVRFSKGIHFTFPVLDVAPGEDIVVVRDKTVFLQQYPDFDGIIAGQYEGNLDNNGEKLRLEDALGETIQEFKYSDNWYKITDGDGFSLTIFDPTADPCTWAESSSWTVSTYRGGSPGRDDDVLPKNAVVINELLAHSHGNASDWIELYNTTDRDINISGWYLSDSGKTEEDLKKYRIPVNTWLYAGGYRVFYEDTHFGDPCDPVNTPFALSENGETVYLSSAINGELTGYREQEDFGPSATGVSFGRYRKSTGTYNFVAMEHPTPGAANSDPLVGPIVITEIMYNPKSGEQREEYVELMNITDQPVTLFDELANEPWKFTDGINYTFPAGAEAITIQPGKRILIVKDKVYFVGRYGIPSGTMLGPYGGQLNNGGEKLELARPGDVNHLGERQYIRIDRVNYNDKAPWPIEADGPEGDGSSLTRIHPEQYGNDAINWMAAPPSPGT